MFLTKDFILRRKLIFSIKVELIVQTQKYISYDFSVYNAKFK